MSEAKKERYTILVFFSIVGWIYVISVGCIKGLGWIGGKGFRSRNC